MWVLFSSAVQFIGYFTLTSNFKSLISREICRSGNLYFWGTYVSHACSWAFGIEIMLLQKTALFANTFLHILCLVLFAVKSCGRNKRNRLSIFLCQSVMKLTENREILFYYCFITYSPFRNRMFNFCRTSRHISLWREQMFQLLIPIVILTYAVRALLLSYITQENVLKTFNVLQNLP